MRSYPGTEFEKTNIAARLLGSWFGRDFGRDDQSRGAVDSFLRLFTHADDILHDLERISSRLTTPILARESVRRIQFSERSGDEDAAVPRYGEDYTYGGGISYGTPVPRAGWTHALDSDLTAIGLLLDKVESPTVTFFPGIDFTIEDGRIFFVNDPFQDGRLRADLVYENGEVVDQTLTLWGVAVGAEKHYVRDHYGFITGYEHDSSYRYRDYINAVWDAWTGGTSISAVTRIAAAVADIPVAGAYETITDVSQDDAGFVIATDKSVYQLPSDSTLSVAVGDDLKPGDQLTTTVDVFRVSGPDSIPDDLQAITLDRGWLAPGYYGDLSFDNRTVPVETTKIDNKLFVSWAIGGWPGDVEQFWAQMHERGLLANQTLAQLMDQRANPIGEPFPESLPAEINPLKFLAANVIRNKAVIIRLRPNRFGSEALPLSFLNILRQIVPPWFGIFVVLELEFEGDQITMDGPGTENSPGYEEGPLASMEVGILGDSIDPGAMITERPRLRYIDGECI